MVGIIICVRIKTYLNLLRDYYIAIDPRELNCNSYYTCRYTQLHYTT